MTAPVNRDLRDEAFGRIDHALGRFCDPLGETCRNYYATETDGALAEEMRRSAHWEEQFRRGGMSWFAVTDAGRRALAGHLRAIGDPHRLFMVSFAGSRREVAAASRSKARYLVFLDLRDCWPELTFGEFCRSVTVAAIAEQAAPETAHG